MPRRPNCKMSARRATCGKGRITQGVFYSICDSCHWKEQRGGGGWGLFPFEVDFNITFWDVMGCPSFPKETKRAWHCFLVLLRLCSRPPILTPSSLRGRVLFLLVLRKSVGMIPPSKQKNTNSQLAVPFEGDRSPSGFPKLIRWTVPRIRCSRCESKANRLAAVLGRLCDF